MKELLQTLGIAIGGMLLIVLVGGISWTVISTNPSVSPKNEIAQAITNFSYIFFFFTIVIIFKNFKR